MWGGGRGGNHGVCQAYFILEKRGGPKEVFTIVGGGSLYCVFGKQSHSLQFMWKI